MNKTLDYFNILSKIPRPSGKEEKVANYLCEFAKSKNLEFFKDDFYNVIIKKPSNNPLKQDKTLILQGHTDMVCEKNNDTTINFDTDPIFVVNDGKFLKAQGTTLGADNGIGVSMILSLLDEIDLSIPNLECVFTTQEETTMLGAQNIDFNKLKGNHLLSIDGTDEGKLEVSSAGMVVTKFSKNFNTSQKNQNFDFNDDYSIFELQVGGLLGGHSGSDINKKDRLNAIKILFEILKDYSCKINLISVCGGGKSNAIPRECSCLFLAQKSIENDIKSNIYLIKDKYKIFDKNLKITLNNKIFKDINLSNNSILSPLDTKFIIKFINDLPNGVLEYSKENTTFPITSCNLAKIDFKNNNLEIIFSLRSSVKNQEKFYLNKVENLVKNIDLKYEILSSAPFFERKNNSYLQKVCKSTYESLYNTPCILEDVHAGLEGGVFNEKKPNLDICVIAPNLFDIHSPNEKAEISSINRVYNWLKEIVKKF